MLSVHNHDSKYSITSNVTQDDGFIANLVRKRAHQNIALVGNVNGRADEGTLRHLQ